MHVRGASEHNLRNVDVDIPRDAMVAFTGVSGSGKSSLAFGTLYAEAQRRYFESVAPYARRLLQQVGAPHVAGDHRAAAGRRPAAASRARRARGRRSAPSRRCPTCCGCSTRGPAPTRRAPTRLEAEAFSPNTAAGACPRCHGLGRRARRHRGPARPGPVAEHPRRRDRRLAGRLAGRQPAQHRQRARASTSTGPGAGCKKKDRDWLLYTDEQPSVLIKPERDRIDYGYYGKFWSARKHVMHVLADSKSQQMRDRAMRFVRSVPCPDCARQRAAAGGARGDLRRALDRRGQRAAARRAVAAMLRPVAELADAGAATSIAPSPARRPRSRSGSAPTSSRGSRCCSTSAWATSASGRRSTTLSPGEAQRLRIATQLRSGLFGVVYVLDEPSAGLHPADAEPLLDVLDRLKASGNSLFVVEHDLDVVRRADWVVDIGPGAGEGGGRVLYSGPVAGLEAVDGVGHRPLPVRPGRAARPRAARRRRAGCTCAASPGTTCATSRSTSRSAC